MTDKEFWSKLHNDSLNSSDPRSFTLTKPKEIPMTHPPIPPHCPHFEGNLFFVPECGFNDAINIDIMRYESSLDWRSIIAGIAFAFWMYEWRRLQNTSGTANEIEMAQENADAWTKWERGEVWK